MHRFQQKKFLGLSSERQHKKCAEMLRALYLDSSLRSLWNHYCEIQLWMGAPAPSIAPSQEHLSNLFHIHLQKAGHSLKEHNLLPRPRQGDRPSPRADALPVAIYLDKLRSAHNIGSIVRTLEAFGLGELLLSPTTPDLENKKVQDAAMGCTDHVRWRFCDLDQLPRPIIALETAENAVPLSQVLFPPSFTLAVGNEEYGCSEALLKAADIVVEIPLWGRKNSLNVANATAIAAAAISQQLRQEQS